MLKYFEKLAESHSRKPIDLESEGIISNTNSLTNLRHSSHFFGLIFLSLCKIKELGNVPHN